MDSKILFEANVWTIQPMVVFCLLLPSWFVIIFLACLSFRKKAEFWKEVWKSYLKIQLVFLIPILFVYCMELVPYHLGRYEIVEGNVENFDGPGPSDRTKRGLRECFSVNGVEFEYADTLVSCGYHKMQINHGIIHPGLKNIRIIYLPRNRNIIMRIESLSDSG